jgi:hypothetical protein
MESENQHIQKIKQQLLLIRRWQINGNINIWNKELNYAGIHLDKI